MSCTGDDAHHSSAATEVSEEMKTHDNIPFPYWSIWKAATTLETDGMTVSKPNPLYADTITQAVSILRVWGHMWAGLPEWQSLLNKSSLQHEVEESIVALYHLHEWMLLQDTQGPPLIVMDVCCGKGLFSMLLSYMVGIHWRNLRTISRIVLLDKATSQTLNWNHIHVANSTAAKEKRPSMELWEGCNLHDYDIVLDRLQGLESPVAMVGIHLCKTLGPSCVGLANGLGPTKCPYLCLAPCCLPRIAITTKSRTRCIPVNLYEEPQERRDRVDAMQRRDVALGRRNVICYLCGDATHRTQGCSLLPVDEEERLAVLKQATATIPCWKCGIVGHFKADCPSDLTRPVRLEPPSLAMDVEKVLHSPQPFDTYCQLLAETLQECATKQILEPGLINASSAHQEGNWNGGRKSIYIVANR